MPEKESEAESRVEILRLDFENALERSRDPAAIACLKALIQTA
jgi:hypothetical protein